MGDANTLAGSVEIATLGIGGVPLPIPSTGAFTTLSGDLLALPVDDQVVTAVGVPGGAMSLGDIPRGEGCTPQQVDASGYRLEVSRVAARSVAAEVVEV